MAKIKNLIFDLDNTLYDFSSIWKKSNELTFNYFGYNKLATYEEFFKEYKKINNELVEKISKGEMSIIHLRNERLIKTLAHYDLSLSVEDCNSYYKKQFEFIAELIQPNRKLNEHLRNLKKDYKLIILTNGNAYEQRVKLQKLEFEDIFSIYISGETHLSKPKREAFLNVIQKENLKIEETMMIGDSLFHDIFPAQKLGFKTCLIERKWHFDDKLRAYKGEKVKDIEQFLSLGFFK